MKNNRILILFNLETNLMSDSLAPAHDWVCELANYYEKVILLSTHSGKFELPVNVRLVVTGGGNLARRARAILVIARELVNNFKSRKRLVVYYHMTHIPATLFGLPLHILRVRQGLWYSHNSTSLSLYLASIFVDVIHTPTSNSFPIYSKKIRQVGHGINIQRFNHTRETTRNVMQILSVGRIARVKRYEVAIEKLSRSNFSGITLVGNSSNSSDYQRELEEVARKSNLQLIFKEPILYEEIPILMSSYQFFYSGTPDSVDKAAVEAALAGCLVISENMPLLTQIGMNEVWLALGYRNPPDLETQFSVFSQLKQDDLERNSSLIKLIAAQKNDLKVLCRKIIYDLDNFNESSSE